MEIGRNMRIGEKIAQFAGEIKSNPYKAVAIGCALLTIAALGVALITEGDLSDVLAGSSIVAFVGMSVAVPCYFYRKKCQELEQETPPETLPGIPSSVATQGKEGYYYCKQPYKS